MNSSDPLILQSSPASCAIKCQQLILFCYGINVSEEELCIIAKGNGWYQENVGVFMRDNGHLLGCFGIAYHHRQYATVADIKYEIKQHHMVMVSLNKYKLIGMETPYPDACHSILVNEIKDEDVYVTDTALGMTGIKYLTKNFLKAWADSRFYMLSTKQPAVYRYHPVTKKMYKIK